MGINKESVFDTLVGRPLLSLVGIKTAETLKERELHAVKLIADAKHSVQILTQRPERYCSPAVYRALSETIRRQVPVEVISSNEEDNKGALDLLASLGVKVYKAREWPQRASDFIVVDEENVQVEERHPTGQEPETVYTIYGFKNASELTRFFGTVKEKAIELISYWPASLKKVYH